MTKACGRGNVPIVKSVRSRKREWSETSETSVNWWSKISKLEPNWFRSSSGRLVSNVLVERDELWARDFVCVLREVLLQWCLTLSSASVSSTRLEVLADLVDVQLRAVLRVVAVKELQEPCVYSLAFVCAARVVLASAARRFVGRMQASKTWRGVSSGRWGVSPAAA